MNVPPTPEEFIQSTPLSEALSQRYLSYALSTIMSRSLPDVRDGLKPVHRRLMHAMRQLRLDPNSKYKKSARVVGDVMGKYHPHGDQAIYDALVRLAQEFSVRYPLIDGQGNFGNIDGDNAAAMRYTESRLTLVAEALLDGLDEDTVDFRETYDGEEREPTVLPANFPNLLANGATGIAVGMATSIPPHNAAELCEAMLHLIKHPKATAEKMVEFVPGPDFPTGGVLVEPHAAIVNAYKTGRGGFRLRARWETEDLGRGQYQIVVTEIPYQVQKSRLIEKIADLINDKKNAALADVRDESTDDIRLDTGLAEDYRKEMAKDLSNILAQTYRLTIKSQIYHWNVVGPIFKPIHDLTEEHYNALFAATDIIAERIRALGHLAPVSLDMTKSFAPGKSDVDQASAHDMVQDLVADHEQAVRGVRTAAGKAGDNDDMVTEDMLTARLTFHEKALWMLRAIIAN